MNSNIADICKTLASNFALLADELRWQQAENEDRMTYIETCVDKNREALKSVANTILETLE